MQAYQLFWGCKSWKYENLAEKFVLKCSLLVKKYFRNGRFKFKMLWGHRFIIIKTYQLFWGCKSSKKDDSVMKILDLDIINMFIICYMLRTKFFRRSRTLWMVFYVKNRSSEGMETFYNFECAIFRIHWPNHAPIRMPWKWLGTNHF